MKHLRRILFLLPALIVSMMITISAPAYAQSEDFLNNTDDITVTLNDSYDIIEGVTEGDLTLTAQWKNKNHELVLELVDDKTEFIQGEPVYVKASGDPNGAAQAWVALYKKGEVPGSGIYPLRWYYVASNENQKANIVDPIYKGDRNDPILPGEYTVFLFGSNDYDIVKKSIDITIVVDPDSEEPEPSDELSLSLVDPNKTTYKLGEKVMIKATGIADHAWVGLYRENETPDNYTPALRWFYIQDGYNGVKVNILSNDFIVNKTDPIIEGEYKILLYGADNYDSLAGELHFKIEGIIDINPDDFTLEVEKTLYMYKEQIRVKASGTGIGNDAWVGLYPADTQTYTGACLYYYYIKEADGIWTVIQNWHKDSTADRDLGDGEYKFVIFADGGYDHPVKTVEFNIPGHDMTEHPAVKNTCDKPGNTAYWSCSRCKKYFADAEGKSEIPENSWVIPAGHDFSGEVIYEWAGDHSSCTAKKVCANDSSHIISEKGVVISGISSAASCEEKGKTWYLASFRDAQFPSEVVYVDDIPKLAHKLRKTEAKAATAEAAGNIEYWTCSVCGRIFADADGNKEIREADTVIDKLPDKTKPAGSDETKSADSDGQQSADPAKQMGDDGTPFGKGASREAVEKAITNLANDNDPKGAAFAPLMLKSTKQTNTNISLTWKKVSGAGKYVVYGNACGKNNKFMLLAETGGNSYKVTKIQKKLKKGTYHKFLVVALDSNNKVVSTSKVIHVATKGKGNHTKLTVSKKIKKGKLSLKKGKSFKIGAKAVGKKVKKHVAVRYESSDPEVATVNAGGKITANKSGNCKIYVYAQNGISSTIKLKVK